MSIRINATVQEARTAANHSQEQWDRFYVSWWARRRGYAYLTIVVYNQRRGKATCGGPLGLEKMDPYPREREGADVGENQHALTSRGHSARRDDNSEVAGISTS
jgi:hypothetical protein